MNCPKRGFGLPMDLWSADKLLPITRSLVLGNDARLPAWLDRRLLGRYLDGMERDFNAYRVWSLYILENWLRSHPAAAGRSHERVECSGDGEGWLMIAGSFCVRGNGLDLR